MKLVRTMGATTLALLLTLPMAACDGGTETEFGSMSIQLTDAPGEEVVEAWVTITDIYLQEESGENDPEGSRVFLLEGASETHELLSLANDVADLVVGQEVPTGTYGQLRIVMSGGCIVTDTGTVFASDGYTECGAATGRLNMPSFAQTGAKVLLNGLEVTGGQQILLLDFDVEDSFGKEAGGSGMWVMSPVIHASEIGLTAAIDVTLSPGDVTLPTGYALGDFSATMLPAEGDSARVAFTDEDDNGTFELAFEFLIPDNGPFDVRLNAPDGLTVTVDPTSPATVEPASGQTAAVDWVLQSATESSAN
jgi:hypothetical protein